ncbi:FAD-binding oxidoreductase [Aurantimonas sp. VKM B-3413]|uniref:FAD-binding oxidoreductase n=1 Tax=Aurantimonas sp. VKM B-3413 TaxID=2779401 RepID=UPI001E30B744|nr:FAD-binding oxidoreductase [Aurantimonas sp. VKM B-3413]MCB8840274.1 FAD-binding oxidoreductase [Aurantimonas sp. VKM B-3413]
MAMRIAELLMERLGGEIVTLGDEIPERARHDWSGQEPVRPLALIRPRSTEEVSATLKLCSEAGIGVVPQGGLTGLAGGAHPTKGCVALSLERLNRIEEIDPAMATMTAGAGVVLQTAQAAAEEAGLFLALDLGARGSCTVGGVLSTNAGGNRVIRYGMAREHVLGLEIVLADGTVVSSLNKMLKNNAGYDSKQLFIGSEGTLGVITRAVLRLQPQPTFSTSALCGCRDFDAVLSLLKAARAGLGPSLTAFEVMWPSFYHFMGDSLPSLPQPLSGRHGIYVLIEVSGFDAERDAARLESLLEGRLEAGDVEDAVIAASGKDVAALWAIRESVSEYTKVLGPIAAFDVGVSSHVTGAVVEQLEAGMAERWPDAISLSYGHVGDSNLHFVANVPSAGAAQPGGEIADFVYATVRAAGGTISAEHGIGTLKRKYLAYSRSPAELDLMRRMKAALDPKGILNPGKVLG